MKIISVVEDEPMMREEIVSILEKAGYEVHAVTEFDCVPQRLAEQSPDLVILDINLPGMSGFEICRRLKLETGIPVLVLTSRDQMRDELHALELGADEFLTKPCRRERLLARTANVLKRYEGRTNLLEGRGFLLDRQTYTLYVNHESVVLPKNQGRLLEELLRCRGTVVPKEELCVALWGTAEYIDENALQVNLTRLKKTMGQYGLSQKILAVRGVGYKLVEDVVEA